MNKDQKSRLYISFFYGAVTLSLIFLHALILERLGAPIILAYIIGFLFMLLEIWFIALAVIIISSIMSEWWRWVKHG